MYNFSCISKVLFCLAFVFVFCQSVSAQANANGPILKVQPNSNWCLGCICEAISNCTRGLQCDGGVCGLFRITWAYWADAGKPTVNNEDPNSQTAYSNCAIDERCAGTTVSNYFNRFKQDCNNDGAIDCYDYAAIHLHGGYGCTPPLTGAYAQKFNECNSQIQTLPNGQT